MNDFIKDELRFEDLLDVITDKIKPLIFLLGFDLILIGVKIKKNK